MVNFVDFVSHLYSLHYYSAMVKSVVVLPFSELDTARKEEAISMYAFGRMNTVDLPRNELEKRFSEEFSKPGNIGFFAFSESECLGLFECTHKDKILLGILFPCEHPISAKALIRSALQYAKEHSLKLEMYPGIQYHKRDLFNRLNRFTNRKLALKSKIKRQPRRL